MRLVPSSELRGQARRVLGAERARLLPAIPDAELLLTGAASLAGTLTKGDVDLHLRVPASGFAAAVELLSRRYRIVHPGIWTAEFATFEVDDYALPTGIALTAIDGEHDRLFIETWRRLATDPAALAAYSTMKKRFADADDATYQSAKSEFFAHLMRGA